jgi:PST family polysaccharide transporter
MSHPEESTDPRGAATTVSRVEPAETREFKQAEHPSIVRLSRGMSLAEGARSGSAWLGGASLGTQAFQFVVSIFMARLLVPSQFGEAAIAFSITTFAQIFTDLGLSAAVVHARRVTDELLSSAFWLNGLTGLGLTVLTCALAVPLASIYGEPSLVGLLILASLNFTFSCGAVPLALLERTLNFRRLAIIETVCTLIAVAAAPIFAIMGFGVYSLVLGPLVGTCLLSVCLWTTVRWWPRHWASRAAIHELWRFSRGLVGFNALNYWSRNLDNLLLGAVVPTAELGEYSRSYNLMLIPVGQMSGVIMRVLFPTLSRMRDEPARMARAWSRALGAASGSVALPLALTMAATAPAMVEVLYGHKWIGMVPVLELLSISAVPQILCTATGGAYRAAGATGLLFRVGVAGTILTVLAIVAGLPWGITGVATTFLINAWILVPVSIGPLARILGIPLPKLLAPIVAEWGPAVAVGAAELLVRLLAPSSLVAWQILALQLGLGGAVYIVTMWRSDSEVALMVKAKIRRFAEVRKDAATNSAR